MESRAHQPKINESLASPRGAVDWQATTARKRFAAAGFALWILVIAGVTARIYAYSYAPGAAGAPPDRWPGGSFIQLDGACPTLMMFVHPHCPCSRASVGELEILMARCQGKIAAHVVFIQPADRDDGWLKTGLWRTASAIPGVSVHGDFDGKETRLFQCETSGDVVVYDQSGRLMFHGGITFARGHCGDNAGRSAIAALVKGEPSGQLHTPAFGCPLFAPDTQAKEPQCKR